MIYRTKMLCNNTINEITFSMVIGLYITVLYLKEK